MSGGIINTQRLILSRVTATDIEHLHLLHQQELVAKFNTIGIPKTLEETFVVIQKVLDDLNKEDARNYAWVIKKKTGEFVGEIGLSLSVPRYKKGEIYFSLMPDFWGQGYAFEAASTIINFGFTALDQHRIEAGVAVKNYKSIALLERLGMQREGRHRAILPLATGWSDNYSYAILNSDQKA